MATDNPLLQPLLDAIAAIGENSESIGKFRNGGVNETVETDGGPVPTLAGFLAQSDQRVSQLINSYIQSVTNASSEADRAETARDAAMVDGRYATVADGLASGDTLFTVVEANRYVTYENDNGTAVERAQAASSSAVMRTVEEYRGRSKAGMSDVAIADCPQRVFLYKKPVEKKITELTVQLRSHVGNESADHPGYSVTPGVLVFAATVDSAAGTFTATDSQLVEGIAANAPAATLSLTVEAGQHIGVLIRKYSVYTGFHTPFPGEREQYIATSTESAITEADITGNGPLDLSKLGLDSSYGRLNLSFGYTYEDYDLGARVSEVDPGTFTRTSTRGRLQQDLVSRGSGIDALSRIYKEPIDTAFQNVTLRFSADGTVPNNRRIAVFVADIDRQNNKIRIHDALNIGSDLFYGQKTFEHTFALSGAPGQYLGFKLYPTSACSTFSEEKVSDYERFWVDVDDVLSEEANGGYNQAGQGDSTNERPLVDPDWHDLSILKDGSPNEQIQLGMDMHIVGLDVGGEVQNLWNRLHQLSAPAGITRRVNGTGVIVSDTPPSQSEYALWIDTGA